MPVEVIQNRRLYQQIADQLSELIESGEYPVGSYLPAERQLSQMFGVSRTSLREALIALEVQGLVKVRVGDGVMVTRTTTHSPNPAKQEVREGTSEAGWELDPELGIALPDFNIEVPPFSLLQTRLLIEPETAALAAVNGSEEQLAGIRQALEQNIEDNDSGSTTHPGDRLLHIRIAEASGNPAYALMIRYLLGHKYGVMFQRLQEHYTSDDMAHRSEQEHKAFVEAICARDAEASRSAMRAHLNSVISIFSRA